MLNILLQMLKIGREESACVLQLATLTANTIKKAMGLLGINVPEMM